MGDSQDSILAACGQIKATRLNEAEAALAAVRQCARQAERLRANLLVLPECAYPAYLLGSKKSYRRADCLRSAAFLDELQQLAQTHGLHIVSGLVREVDDRLFNEAVLVTPEGAVASVYDKTLLWNVDKKWFDVGTQVRAADCALGRIGILICADLRVPELMATLVAAGAQLVVLPTCWINSAQRPGEFYNPLSDFLVRARSMEFGVPMVCANKHGVETGTTGYNGQSMITDAAGRVLAQAAGDRSDVISAELRLERPPPPIVREPYRSRLLERRPARGSACPPDQRLKIELWSGNALRERLRRSPRGTPLSSATQADVALLVAHGTDAATRQQLASWAQGTGITVLTEPAETRSAPVGGVELATVGGRDADTFEAIRAHALDGAKLICVFGRCAHPALLRARALENRVFVANVSDADVRLIGVNGKMLLGSETAAPEAGALEIKPARADDKFVAPGTDIFADRLPHLYRF